MTTSVRLADNLRSDVKAVAEGHEILLLKIEDTKAELSQSINNIERRIDNLDKNMATVKDWYFFILLLEGKPTKRGSWLNTQKPSFYT